MNNRMQSLSPFEAGVDSSTGTLSVSIGGELRDGDWGAHFGKLQYAIRAKEYDGEIFTHLVLDIRDCKWADPTPLLSLSIALGEFEREGGQISGKIPSPESASYQTQRFIKFLAQEGFLDLLAFPFPATGRELMRPRVLNTNQGTQRELKRKFLIDKELLTREKIDELARLELNLAYNNSTCLPAEFIEVGGALNDKAANTSFAFEDVDRWVEDRLVRVIGPVIIDKVPLWAQSTVLYRLQIFLREILHNTIEHAYQDHDYGYAAVYIRYRQGMLGASESVRRGIEPHLVKENNINIVPLMPRSYVDEHSGFFEIYVVDAGQGLCRSLGTIDEYPENPLHKTMLDVFGGRRRGGQKSTLYGGLWLLRELMEPHKDYFRTRDEDAWWGRILPLPTKWPEAGRFFVRAGGDAYPIKGLSWTARLSWLDDIDLIDKGKWYGWEASEDHPLLRELAESIVDIEQFRRISIFDFRFSEKDTTKISNQPNTSYILVLPKARWMKNEIQHRLREVISQSQLKNGGALIVGDIPPDETPTYLAALDHARAFSEGPLSLVQRIVLVTKNLRACVLRRKESVLYVNKVDTRSFIACRNPNKLSPQSSLLHFFRLLRWHDSSRLWRTIRDQLKYDKAFFYGKIAWSEQITLVEFLDFAQTLTHPICRSLYIGALSRTPALFPDQVIEVSALDSLVENIVVQFRTQLHTIVDTRSFASKSIAVGSIQVSGLTERRAGTCTHVIHFLRHPQAKSSNTNCLFLWPKGTKSWRKNFPKSDKSYARVGRTPVVAEHGWKAYPLFRFSKTGESVYTRSPSDSYRDWQEFSRTLMKIGHWRYGGHHDLLSVNLLLAFDSELDRIRVTASGSVAGFVIGSLMAYFGLIKNELTDEGQRILSAILSERQLSCPHKQPSRSHVVYISHPVTDHIIDRFLSLINGSTARNEIRRRMIGILPIRRSRTGSTLLVSGLLLERLVEIAKETPTPPVLMFDDAVLTGRTYQEVKQLLINNGFKRIDSLTLLDRQRLPDSSYIYETDRRVRNAYWRLDVPPMGNDSDCLLCSALSILRQFSGAVSKIYEQYILRICNEWVARNPATEWSSAGIGGTPLNGILTKRFGITEDGKQIGGDEQKIHIRNSIGLVCYITELQSMTSRDDLSLNILDDQHLNPESRIHILASHLLIFGREVDYKLELELCEKLIIVLSEISDTNKHTNLALLALMSRKPDVLRNIYMWYQSSVYKSLNNKDITVLVAYGLDIGWLEYKSGFIDAKKILKTKIVEAYVQFHKEVNDKDGPAHQPALVGLKLSGIRNNPQDTISPAADSSEKIVALLEWIPEWRYRSSQDASVSSTRKLLILCKKKCQEFHEHAYSLLKDEPIEIKLENMDKLRKCSSVILNETNKLHDRLFWAVGLQSLRDGKLNQEFCKYIDYLCKEAATRASLRSGKGSYSIMRTQVSPKKLRRNSGKFKNTIRESYILFDSVIEKAFIELMSNAHHATSIISQKGIFSSKKNAHMWIDIDPQPDIFILSLINATQNSINEIEEGGKKSWAYRDIRNVGGVIKYGMDSDGIVEVKIGLPYAHQAIVTDTAGD